MKNKDFVHLHVHSEYSIQDSLLPAAAIAEQAKACGMWAAAITDVHNLFGAVKFYQACVKSGIKPIIGCEVRIADWDQDQPKNPAQIKQVEDSSFRLLLYCQHAQGYHNLCKLLTRSYQEGQWAGIAYIALDWLTPNDCQGLIGVEPGMKGFSARTQITDLDQLKTWLDIFPNNRYLIGLHRIGLAGESAWERRLSLLYQSSSQSVPLVALGGVCFAAEQDYNAHEIRVCIQSSQVLGSRTEKDYTTRQHWRSQTAMCQQFSDLENAVLNTLEIAKRCNIIWSFKQTFLPDFPVPEGQTLDVFLANETQKGLIARGDDLVKEKAYQDRINIELDIIKRMGFAGYFLIVADFIQWAKSQAIPVGPGRGSGAGSLVAFCLGITDIDPLPHGLLFERFLNPERVSMPDFDVDFCMTNRDKVIAYVGKRYGRQSVAQIITYGSMAAKASVRDVGRVLGHPYGFVDKLAKLIPLDLGITLTKALEQSPELASRYQSETDVKTLLDHALSLEGRVRNVGRHAGGVVISPGALTDFCALYLEQDSTHQVTQLDMGDVERVGLVKFDFLGLRTLTIIDQAVRWIRASGLNKSLDISSIKLDDTKTFQLLKSGKTTAVFQLESRGFQELIERLKPDVFADIVALVALYRPGPLQSGMVDDFIERKHGRAKVAYLHPCMATILKDTYGVIVYQEQVMQIAQEMAGYTLGAADLLRRAMGKKKPEEMAKQRAIFLEGSVAREVDADLAGSVFDLMEKFAGYGFNKSHSVAYAFISYQTAYLKAHNPDYFMASVLSSDMDNTDKLVHYIDDCVAQGLVVRGPCIQQSKAMFSVCHPGQIRYALGAIKGVGEGMAEAIVTERESGQTFKDLLDFCIRMADKVNRKVLEALIMSGAMDVWQVERAVLMGSIDKILAQKDQFVKSLKHGQSDLFGQSSGGLLECVYGDPLPNWLFRDQMAYEKQVLGMYFSGHPLDPYQDEIRAIRCVGIKQLKPGIGKQIVKLAGIALRQKRMSTKQGRLFLLIELADKTGSIEVACFDDKMIQVQQAMDEHDILIVEGYYLAGRGGGHPRFQLQRVQSLKQWRADKAPKIYIELNEQAIKSDTGMKLRDYLYSPSVEGCSQVVLFYQSSSGERVQLKLKKNVFVTVTDELLAGLNRCVESYAIKFDYDV